MALLGIIIYTTNANVKALSETAPRKHELHSRAAGIVRI